MNNEIFELIKNDPALKALKENKEVVSNLSTNEQALIFASYFRDTKRNLVIVCENTYNAQQLYYRIWPILNNDVLLFTVEESLRVEALAASGNIYANQMETLTNLVLSNKPKVVITHPSGIIRYLPSKETFRNHIIELAVGQVYDIKTIKKILIESGYKQTNRVDQPLTFSHRGSVIDVFSVQQENPLRIEFFDDEIESLRYFDLSTQRTIEKVEKCLIVPASTLIYDEDFEIIENKIRKKLNDSYQKAFNYDLLEETINRDISYLKNHVNEHYLYRYQSFFNNQTSILSYIDNAKVILTNTDNIESNLQLVINENNEYISELFSNDCGLNYYNLFDEFDYLVDKYQPYHIFGLSKSTNCIKSDIRPVYFPLLPLDKIMDEIIRISQNHNIYLSINKGQKEILTNEFKRNDKELIDYVKLLDTELIEGFEASNVQVYSGKELFGLKNTKSRYESKFKEALILDSYQDLQIGDYVVHNQYGIGKYDGIVTKEINGKIRDYLRIIYKDEEILLVPLEQFQLVRKFVSSESVGVRLSKLGSNSWNKTKEKIAQEVNDIAQRLIELYSSREEDIGFAFSADDENQRAFEDNFPYELTTDQQKAIAQVKYDMEQLKPMDRLLCGDVGFGKTEVAMVAAFKAIKDLKQVAYLCPTTILSRQHYNTFVERFKGFPVKIALVNRFVEPTNVKQILKLLKEGKIDILIGTHRLLSQDVKFADLGLLIIDEEQRFGVAAKEKIKELKKSIDVLSLSATPIPRTLQMSLVGVMNLSQLETPPKNRMPIQTYVVEKNDHLIKEVIQRELARNGQVFYLHNNVSDIYNLARKLSVMLPDGKIAVAHGQMNREEIEDVMYRFVDYQYDILICTTIIETGIDIPNVNTIIIDNADTFGLSQLYQIRGRVGRSDKIAYAYLMYRYGKQLSETASKRLQAIKDFTELGSGYKVAMRDLTIRGAGDLLGERQAGFINTIGMSLYLDMLNKAINEKKGISQEIIEHNNIKINDVDGYIPGEFVNVDYEKIDIYQQLDKINSLEQLNQYYDKISDYYGKLPNTIDGLFEKKKIEILLSNPKIEDYQQLTKENRIVLTKQFSDNLDGVKLFEKMNNISNLIRLKYSQGKITILIDKVKKYMDIIVKVLDVIDKL